MVEQVIPVSDGIEEGTDVVLFQRRRRDSEESRIKSEERRTHTCRKNTKKVTHFQSGHTCAFTLHR
jgi:hypothetical protein